MNLLLLNRNFESIISMVTYESLQWNERYNEAGDFEITYKTNIIGSDNLSGFINMYVYAEDTDKMMIIETIEVSFDVDEGYTLSLRGRSLESIINRRIIPTKITVDGNLESFIQSLINDNFVNPTNPARQIPILRYKQTSSDRIKTLTVTNEYQGDNVYDVVSALCKQHSIGFKVVFNDDDKMFDFELYEGVDRSASQYFTPEVLFSSTNGSISNSNYLYSTEELKNVVSVQGPTQLLEVGNQNGLDRRETYLDESSLEDDTTLSEKGTIELLEYKAEEIFDIESTDNSERYYEDEILENFTIYRTTYFLGDIVQTDNTFGSDKRARVQEFSYSVEASGPSYYPTLTTIDEDKTF